MVSAEKMDLETGNVAPSQNLTKLEAAQLAQDGEKSTRNGALPREAEEGSSNEQAGDDDQAKANEEDDATEYASAGDKSSGKFCYFYQRGLCTKGSGCSFLHQNKSNKELTPEERARLYKTKPCRFFGFGQCTKGDDCPYIHPGDEIREVNLDMMAGNGRRTPDSRPFKENNKSRNKPQQPTYNNYKTRQCKYFPVGKCKRGMFCTFAHGNEAVPYPHACHP